MRNPLIRRVPRELKSDWHKYLVIIIFMVLMIGVISGMYVGHDSMLAAVYGGRETLNLEDGRFELNKEATDDFLKGLSKGKRADVRRYYIDKGNAEVEKAVDEEWDEAAKKYELDSEDFKAVPVDIYENFYREEPEDNDNDGVKDANVRIYKSDSEIDKASFNEGRAPEKDNEIAIDRMHASNVGVKVGDSITVGGKSFEVVGLLSYVNYLTLHESNTDLMFDAFGFDVAMVTPEAFDRFKSRVHYNYGFKYKNPPSDKVEKADYSGYFLKALITQTLVNDLEIEDYLPEYLRQASNFAVSDIEGDSAGTAILCYILIGVIAFIFAITISNTIDKESSVIGTLRASGYSRGELVVHYMSMPVVVTILGAIIGNVFGYTLFKDVAVNLYYDSYSLPTCHAVWNSTALVKTTIIPLVLMFFINLFVIIRKLRLSPLKFLRHDLVKTKRSKAMRLPRWSFLRRFRLRILFQNMPNYLVLIFGVVFIELMMCFAFGLPDSLNHYADVAADMMFAPYQYVLMDCEDDDGNVIETSEETAERFNMESLLYPKKKSSFRTGMGSGGDESVSVFGVVDDSKYMPLKEKPAAGEVYISSAFSKKFGIVAGDDIELHAEYENKSYSFTVKGVVDYDGGIAAFMDRDNFKEIFEVEDDKFSGFFSQNEITDIDDEYIGMVITSEDIMKVTNQLNHSMGGIINVFKYVLIVMTAALIYLLAKIIIERNEHAISMVKILGFKNGEVGRLYIVPTAIVVVLCSIVGFVVGYYLMVWIFHIFMLQMDGYFAYFMRKSSMVLSVVYLLVGYMFVTIIDYIRIKRIPLDVALKNVE